MLSLLEVFAYPPETSTPFREDMQKPPGTDQHLWGVTWSGKQFVAVGEDGTILLSRNGNIWTTQRYNTLDYFKGVASSDSLLMIAGGDGTILTSS